MFDLQENRLLDPVHGQPTYWAPVSMEQKVVLSKKKILKIIMALHCFVVKKKKKSHSDIIK